MTISLIFALDEDNAIGFDNKLPWHLPADLKRFKELTMGHHIIMGRHTAESLGKALPGRVNIVITSNQYLNIPGMIISSSLSQALDMARETGEDEAFIIGGAMLFNEALPIATKYYQTRIHHVFGADTYLPAINMDNWRVLSEEFHPADEKNHYDFTFRELERKS
jgi:dihydrofolate reductase